MRSEYQFGTAFSPQDRRSSESFSLCDNVRNTSQEEANVKHISVRMGLVTLLACAMMAIFTSSVAAQDAGATFKAKCALCHGADGKGSAMGTKMGVHDWSSADVQKMTDAQLTEVITKGKGKMPSYDGKLKDTEIKDLVAFIRSLGKK